MWTQPSRIRICIMLELVHIMAPRWRMVQLFPSTICSPRDFCNLQLPKMCSGKLASGSQEGVPWLGKPLYVLYIVKSVQIPPAEHMWNWFLHFKVFFVSPDPASCGGSPLLYPVMSWVHSSNAPPSTSCPLLHQINTPVFLGTQVMSAQGCDHYQTEWDKKTFKQQVREN